MYGYEHVRTAKGDLHMVELCTAAILANPTPPQAHATMLAARATITNAYVSPRLGPWGVWAPHSGTPDLLYSLVTLWLGATIAVNEV